MIIDQNPKKKMPWKEVAGTKTTLGAVPILTLIPIIEGIIRIWNSLQRARERKKQRDKESK